MSDPPSSVAMTGVGVGSSTIRKGPSTKKAIKWRRDKVLELMSKGVVRLSHLSQQIQVSEATIKRDRRVLAKEAYSEIVSYEPNTLLFMMVKQGTFDLIDKAWEIVNSEIDANTRIQAMHTISHNYERLCSLTMATPIFHAAKIEVIKNNKQK
jgi:hypothetical protein